MTKQSGTRKTPLTGARQSFVSILAITGLVLFTRYLHADDQEVSLVLPGASQGMEVRYHQYHKNGRLELSSTNWSVVANGALVARSDVLDVMDNTSSVLFYPEYRKESETKQRVRESLIMDTLDPTELLMRAIHNLLPQAGILGSRDMLKGKLAENNVRGQTEFNMELPSGYLLQVSIKSDLRSPTITSITVKDGARLQSGTALSAVASDFAEIFDSQLYPKTVCIKGPNGDVVFVRRTSTISNIKSDASNAQSDLLATRIYIDQPKAPVVVARPLALVGCEYWFLLNLLCLAGFVSYVCFYNRI